MNTAQSHKSERSKYWNTMSTTTPGQGGNAVKKLVAKEIADALKTYSSMRRVSQVIQTTHGADMNWVSSDGRTEEGEQLAQNAPTADSSPTEPSFGNSPLNVFKYSSRIVRVPLELIQDAAVDLGKFIDDRLATRIGRITNRKLTTGTGTNEPMGVVTAASIGKAAVTGQTLTVLYDDLEDLIYSVDPAYREKPTCGWMLHEQTLRTIRKMKDSTGRRLVPFDRDANGQLTMLDYPVTINNDMPIMAANAKSILFGDFSTYVIRDAMDWDVRVMSDSGFMLYGQIGFLAFARTGGSLVDTGGSIKAYQNSAT